jgi:hypothetical protein
MSDQVTYVAFQYTFSTIVSWSIRVKRWVVFIVFVCWSRHFKLEFLTLCKRAERSESCTVFARSEAVIVGSILTQGMNVWCVYAFLCVCVVLCLGSGLATGQSLVQGVLPSVKWLKRMKENLDTCIRVYEERIKKTLRKAAPPFVTRIGAYHTKILSFKKYFILSSFILHFLQTQCKWNVEEQEA